MPKNESLSDDDDTIAAIATPPGRGGVGIIRLSGSKAQTIAKTVFGLVPQPRFAALANAKNQDEETLDQGILLFFPGPNSFTGEDVIEFQGHGGPVVMDRVMQAILQRGARPAQPGEFSQRAFLNDKLDLVQAEAIADLIDAGSEQAARSALRSLTGGFSEKINQLVTELTHLRTLVEAAIDFPDEEIDFIKESDVGERLKVIAKQCHQLLTQSAYGVKLNEGIKIVIAGLPNAGKSSLLNVLTENDHAIVTDIAGTTRDAIKVGYNLDGVPVHFVDTAGLRKTHDKVEMIGIERSRHEIKEADLVLLVTGNPEEFTSAFAEVEEFLSGKETLIHVDNKMDLRQEASPGAKQTEEKYPQVSISAKENKGSEQLKELIKQHAGIAGEHQDSFVARRRHLNCIELAYQHITSAQVQLEILASELIAEELRLAQQHLGEITGEFTADDLLGEIFSSFCIGK